MHPKREREIVKELAEAFPSELFERYPETPFFGKGVSIHAVVRAVEDCLNRKWEPAKKGKTGVQSCKQCGAPTIYECGLCCSCATRMGSAES